MNTFELAIELSKVGSAAAQETKDKGGSSYNQAMASAKAYFESFEKMSYHALDLERQLTASKHEEKRLAIILESVINDWRLDG